jgi:hypothetical protein
MMDEFQKALQGIKNGKATGIGGINTVQRF